MAITDNSTSDTRVAVGTTVQRPGTPLPGMVRVNTTTNQYEVYITTQWTNFKAI
jgi:hypothetical protein